MYVYTYIYVATLAQCGRQGTFASTYGIHNLHTLHAHMYVCTYITVMHYITVAVTSNKYVIPYTAKHSKEKTFAVLWFFTQL